MADPIKRMYLQCNALTFHRIVDGRCCTCRTAPVANIKKKCPCGFEYAAEIPSCPACTAAPPGELSTGIIDQCTVHKVPIAKMVEQIALYRGKVWLGDQKQWLIKLHTETVVELCCFMQRTKFADKWLRNNIAAFEHILKVPELPLSLRPKLTNHLHNFAEAYQGTRKLDKATRRNAIQVAIRAVLSPDVFTAWRLVPEKISLTTNIDEVRRCRPEHLLQLLRTSGVLVAIRDNMNNAMLVKRTHSARDADESARHRGDAPVFTAIDSE